MQMNRVAGAAGAANLYKSAQSVPAKADVEASKNLGRTDKEEIYKVELSSEAVDMARQRSEKETQRTEEMSRDRDIQMEAQRQMAANQASVQDQAKQKRIDLMA